MMCVWLCGRGEILQVHQVGEGDTSCGVRAGQNNKALQSHSK